MCMFDVCCCVEDQLSQLRLEGISTTDVRHCYLMVMLLQHAKGVQCIHT